MYVASTHPFPYPTALTIKGVYVINNSWYGQTPAPVCNKIVVSVVDDRCCNVIKVTGQQNNERLYYITNDRLNGKRYYTNQNYIIWYMKKFKSWAIGHKNILGTYYYNIVTAINTYEPCPDRVNYWYYYTRNYTWKSGKNIIKVECYYQFKK